MVKKSLKVVGKELFEDANLPKLQLIDRTRFFTKLKLNQHQIPAIASLYKIWILALECSKVWKQRPEIMHVIVKF